MDKLKEELAKIAPFIICWAMGIITYYMAENVEKGFEALVSIIGVFK